MAQAKRKKTRRKSAATKAKGRNVARRIRHRRGSKVPISPASVQSFVKSLFSNDLHARRVMSLADGTIGTLHATALGVHAIGRGLASAKGLNDKSAIKQADRLLSNMGIDVWEMFAQWVPYVVGKRKAIRVNLDWTEFDPDDHSMLVLSLQTKHGRSTPLLWITVVKSELADQRNDHEDRLLIRLNEVLPQSTKATIVAFPENQLTVEFWLQPVWGSGAGGYAQVFTAGLINCFVSVEVGGNLIQGGIGNGANWEILTGDAGAVDLDDGQWHYVAMTYDGMVLTLFIDGQKIQNMTPTTTVLDNPEDYKVGGRPSNTFLKGAMDEVRRSDVARTPTEIAGAWSNAQACP